jgi:hypothetical protein
MVTAVRGDAEQWDTEDNGTASSPSISLLQGMSFV